MLKLGYDILSVNKLNEGILQGMIKAAPLNKNYEFLRVYKKGRFYVGKFIILYCLANNLNINRLGITASRKVGKSVRRNRIRRLVKENFRMYEEYLNEGFDLVFVARSNDTLPTFLEIKREMKFLFKKLNILNQEKWDCAKRS